MRFNGYGDISYRPLKIDMVRDQYNRSRKSFHSSGNSIRLIFQLIKLLIRMIQLVLLINPFPHKSHAV